MLIILIVNFLSFHIYNNFYSDIYVSDISPTKFIVPMHLLYIFMLIYIYREPGMLMLFNISWIEKKFDVFINLGKISM